MSFKVSFSGLLFSDEINARTQNAIDESLLYGGLLIEKRTPRRTGTLARGWEFDDSSIFNETFYTDYVENGTIKMNGAFMVRDSLPEIEERLLDNLIEALS